MDLLAPYRITLPLPVEADEYEDLRRKVEEAPSHDLAILQDELGRTMEQAQREGNLERYDSYKELLRLAFRRSS